VSIKHKTFDETLAFAKEHFRNKVSYSQFSVTEQVWMTVTFEEVEARARLLARKLIQSGLKHGDRVAILGEASIDWIITFYAAMLTNSVVVPLDVKLNETELSNIINHAEPKYLFSSETYFDLSRRLRHVQTSSAKLFGLSRPWPDSFLNTDDEFLFSEDPEALAVICYTSGTLADPKGVMIKKESLLTQMHSLSLSKSEADGASVTIFSILPLNHIYGLTAGPLAAFRSGFELCFPHILAPNDLKKCLKDRKVQQFFTVPLYLKMVMNEILNKVRSAGAVKFFVFKALLLLMRIFPIPRLQKFFFKEIHNYFEGHLTKFISGGAPLPASVERFFRSVGLNVYEGYGLTETGPVICVNTEASNRPGSVGQPILDVEVKLSEDNEILTRGPSVFAGYWKNESLYQESFTSDGWFKTGDYGRYEGGFLSVIGRKKSLIVLPTGKKVHPEEVESFLVAAPSVRHCCVLGMRERIIAVIQPTDDLISSFKGNEKE
jgi:long-chain acyl-CoA synthetase